MRRLFALGLIPLLVLVGACGDDDDDAAGGSSETTVVTSAPNMPEADADCRVTMQEASAAVGLTLHEDGTEPCTWTSDSGNTHVSVEWFSSGGQRVIDGAGDAWSDLERVESVQGADEAVRSAGNSGLVARAGDTAVRVFVEGPDIELDDPQGVAVVLAEVAFGALTTEGE